MIAKEDFDSMDIERQIEIVNGFLSKGMSLAKICETEKVIDISRRALKKDSQKQIIYFLRT